MSEVYNPMHPTSSHRNHRKHQRELLLTIRRLDPQMGKQHIVAGVSRVFNVRHNHRMPMATLLVMTDGLNAIQTLVRVTSRL
eukprot:6451779-Pyramimonas_sp.AAC.2